MYLSKHVNMCKRIHVSILTYKHVNIRHDNMYTPYPPFGLESISTGIITGISTRITLIIGWPVGTAVGGTTMAIKVLSTTLTELFQRRRSRCQTQNVEPTQNCRVERKVSSQLKVSIIIRMTRTFPPKCQDQRKTLNQPEKVSSQMGPCKV